MTKAAAVYSLVAAVVMLLGLWLASRWVEAHPLECDDDCKAQRAKQWQRVAD